MITPTRIAEITALAEAATPVSGGVTYRDMGDGEDRYDVLGFPCGFPVARFGTVDDAAFFAAARTAVPELLAEREAMVARMAVLEGAAQKALELIEHNAVFFRDEDYDPIVDLLGAALKEQS